MAKRRPVVWAHTATRDLKAIADFISRDLPAYAAGFVRRVKETSRSLGEFSERGRIVPEFGNKSNLLERYLYMVTVLFIR